jgi:hypothetical protein
MATCKSPENYWPVDLVGVKPDTTYRIGPAEAGHYVRIGPADAGHYD